MTADEIKEEYELLAKDLMYAHVVWTLFRELFDTENFEAFNKVSSLAWMAIQNATIDSIVLSLTKLSDPAQHGKRDNLTLARLIEIVSSDSAVKARFTDKLEPIKVVLEDLSKHRNKRIGHTDLNHKKKVEVLPAMTRAKIAKAFEVIDDLASDIGRQLGINYATFEPVTEPTGLSIGLYLRAGVKIINLEAPVVTGRISKDELYEQVREIVRQRPY